MPSTKMTKDEAIEATKWSNELERLKHVTSLSRQAESRHKATCKHWTRKINIRESHVDGPEETCEWCGVEL